MSDRSAASATQPDLPSPIGEHPLDVLLTPERARRYRQVLARRTGRLAVVVEDCHDPHNATAVVRTCDAFGVQELHVTTARNSFKINRNVSQGTDHYVDLHVHTGITAAIVELRSRGFRVLVSDLAETAEHDPDRLADVLDASPLALVFGNEGDGVSAEARGAADGNFLIPMVGFTQSLNLSVSVAVTLFAVRRRALVENRPGDLPPQQQRELYERWVHARKGRAAELVMRREHGRHGEDLETYRA
jgi:tRNA (guanosine-2'-O-)-methyltransferase